MTNCIDFICCINNGQINIYKDIATEEDIDNILRNMKKIK